MYLSIDFKVKYILKNNMYCCNRRSEWYERLIVIYGCHFSKFSTEFISSENTKDRNIIREKYMKITAYICILALIDENISKGIDFRLIYF